MEPGMQKIMMKIKDKKRWRLVMRQKADNKRNTTVKLWLTMMISFVCMLVWAEPVQAYDEYSFLYVGGT